MRGIRLTFALEHYTSLLRLHRAVRPSFVYNDERSDYLDGLIDESPLERLPGYARRVTEYRAEVSAASHVCTATTHRASPRPLGTYLARSGL